MTFKKKQKKKILIENSKYYLTIFLIKSIDFFFLNCYTKNRKLLKGEKAMYVLLLFLLLAIPMFNVYTSSLLSETNNEVEKLNKNIEKQELVNQGLSMQIDELASLENIQSIAEENGLSYNNSNIKSVGE